MAPSIWATLSETEDDRTDVFGPEMMMGGVEEASMLWARAIALHEARCWEDVLVRLSISRDNHLPDIRIQQRDLKMIILQTFAFLSVV